VDIVSGGLKFLLVNLRTYFWKYT